MSHQRRIRAHEDEREDDSENGGETVGDDHDFHCFAGQPLVPVVASSAAPPFADNDKDRGTQHEGSKIQVQLGGQPERGTGSYDRYINCHGPVGLLPLSD